MSKRLIVAKLMILVLGLMSLPVSFAQISTQSASIKISAYIDDPFVAESEVGRMEASRFNQDENGHPLLTGKRVSLTEEDFIYRQNATTNLYEKFALNPWPFDEANKKGNFKFADEARFPLFKLERDADGKVILQDGLQVWTPIDIHLGRTNAFAACNAARDAAEVWAGRDIAWGVDNVLDIECHAFIDFNAFYSPVTRSLFFGVIPYRLRGETEVKMFETATSWETVAHESGHALHDVLKPNVDQSDPGYGVWTESFGDQTEMWASLRDPRRVRAVLAETAGNLYTSNSLTRFVEAFAALVGVGTGIRDAFHDLKISDTSDEVHDRSQVLTGAAYKVFTLIHDDLKSNSEPDDTAALTKAGDIMGIFLTRSTDYTPENAMTLEDVGKAYLKVDKEFYGGRHQAMFADEFTRREIFSADSVEQWMAHEAAVPDLRLPKNASDKKVDKLVQANLDQLGIGPDFGLKLQSVIRDERFGQTIVRVQLTDGRGDDAPLFDNVGILTFRADRTLADYYSPLPEDAASSVRTRANAQTLLLVNQAKRFGLDHRGGRLAIVRRPGGRLAVEARVMRSQGIYAWVEAFTMEHPEGERREIIIPTVPRKLSGLQPNGVQILTADDLSN
jgi:hypothetical protein